MTDLEPLLRKHFSAEAELASPSPALLERLEARHSARRRTRTRLAVAGLASLVVAAGVGISFARDANRSGPAAVPTAGVNLPAVATPAGMKAVTWAGIQMFVPNTSQWITQPYCRQPYGIVYPTYAGPQHVACFAVLRSGPDELELGDTSAHSVAHGGVSAVVAGLSATVRRFSTPDAPADGRSVISIVVPSVEATFEIRTPTAAEGERILATAHRVSHDENGCPVTEPATPSTSSLTLCQYADGRLRDSATLTPPEESRLDAARERAQAAQDSTVPLSCTATVFLGAHGVCPASQEIVEDLARVLPTGYAPAGVALTSLFPGCLSETCLVEEPYDG